MRSMIRNAVIGLVVAVAAAGCSKDSGASPSSTVNVPFSNTDLRVGTGTEATAGRSVTVNYTGWLYNTQGVDNKGVQFDTSVGRTPLVFVLGTSQVVGYYAGRDIVPVPYASPRQVVAFGRHYGVRYLVVDRGNTVRFRPQLASLLSAHPGPGLKRVFGGRAPYTGVVVLELVPRPPKFRGEIPLLDQPPKD